MGDLRQCAQMSSRLANHSCGEGGVWVSMALWAASLLTATAIVVQLSLCMGEGLRGSRSLGCGHLGRITMLLGCGLQQVPQ